MVLDLAVRSFQHSGTAAVTQFLIDMPITPKRICLIRQVHFLLVDAARLVNYDVSYGMSLDPDDPGTSLIAADSRMFISGRFTSLTSTAVGFQFIVPNPTVWHFPEGLRCPYARLPWFIQHSNNSGNVSNYRVTVFFELVPVSARDLTIAVLRRGRGETRRVP